MKLESKYKTFIHENAFENVVCKMAVILFRGRWINIASITFNFRSTPWIKFFQSKSLAEKKILLTMFWHCWDTRINASFYPVLSPKWISKLPTSLPTLKVNYKVPTDVFIKLSRMIISISTSRELTNYGHIKYKAFNPKMKESLIVIFHEISKPRYWGSDIIFILEMQRRCRDSY